MRVYLRAQCEVSSIIITSFRQGEGVFLPYPQPQKEPVKSPPRLRLSSYNLQLIKLKICQVTNVLQ